MTHFQEKLIKAASGRYNMSEESAKLYFRKAMQEHTAQTLDRLKTKLIRRKYGIKQSPNIELGRIREIDNLIQLIKEVSDEQQDT